MNKELERFQSIKTFPQLIDYLRDELEWDFQTEDIEDLTFDYEPEELGLDEDTATKITSIKQLRPLVANQSWGIFYIDFEPKKLPVVALRRILGKLVIKRRATSKDSSRAAWQMHDLLFISSCGERATRTMTFAHFSDNTEFGDLPTLKTLSWNNLDTVSHLQHAHATLKDKLHFPDNPNDAESWRKLWSSAFTQKHGEVVRTSKQLAIRLAELATNIRESANKVLQLENEKGSLRRLYNAFQEALIHDLSEDDFADMYAQTVSYGLLTAKISRPAGLVANNLADMIPVTNPFLKELLQTFLVVGGRGNLIDFDELGINDVVEMLRKADMEAVLRDFGDRNPTEDPAIHFYELFLKEYDPEKRMKRGVFYTPRPVVSFIVRSVHEILQKEFGLEDGLASTTTWHEFIEQQKIRTPHSALRTPEGVSPNAPFVQILDPATGTGTFLVEVIEQIHKTMIEKWQREGKDERTCRELWNEYVPNHLLPRLFGFELMMAPYSIAHMKIGLILKDTDYNFLSSERAQIYLTNTLEEPKDFSDYFAVMSPALAHEAEAANRVKRNAPITVVIGNPPYSISSVNKSGWIEDLMKDYKRDLDERNIQPLSDDYIKFIRFAEYSVRKSGIGILAYISNNSYLDGRIHRRIRQHLVEVFNYALCLDLHGSIKKNETSKEGRKDENVFDIQQGVSIALFVKTNFTKSEIYNYNLFGNRDYKYQFLNDNSSKSIKWEKLSPLNPYWLFVPINFTSFDEYNLGFPLSKMARALACGIVTARDQLLVHYSLKEAEAVLKDFQNLQETVFREKYNEKQDSRDWSLSAAQKESQKAIIRFVDYRPFDRRFALYSARSKGIVSYPRHEIMKEMGHSENIALLVCKQQSTFDFQHIFVTRHITDKCTISLQTKEVSYHIPLYLYPTERDKLFNLTTSAPPAIVMPTFPMNLSKSFLRS